MEGDDRFVDVGDECTVAGLSWVGISPTGQVFVNERKLPEEFRLHLHGLQFEIEANLGGVERELVVGEGGDLGQIEHNEVVREVVVGQLLDCVDAAGPAFLHLFAPGHGTHCH